MNRSGPQISQISTDSKRRKADQNDLRKSAQSVDHSLPPREISVHIEELVLHGFDPHARWSVGDALENQLRGLLVERGVPAAWLATPERLTTTSKVGEGIAEAIFRGGAKP
jgi:hypothetical protein